MRGRKMESKIFYEFEKGIYFSVVNVNGLEWVIFNAELKVRCEFDSVGVFTLFFHFYNILLPLNFIQDYGLRILDLLSQVVGDYRF